MNNNPQGFSFPPPPPPPPSSQQQHHQPHQPPHQQHPHPQQQYHHGYNAAPYAAQYNAGYHGQQRGGRAPGAHHRGRGRGGYGSHHRGGGGGGGRGGSHYMAPDMNANRGYSSATVAATGPGPVGGYTPMNYAGYTPQPLSATARAIPTPQFAPTRSPNFQHRTSAAPSYNPPQPYVPAPVAHVPTPYQAQQNYPVAAAQPAPTYSPAVPPHNHVTPTVQPPLMGPPMRWGFDNSGSTGGFAGGQRGHQRGGRAFNHHNVQPDKQTNHGNKRDHNSAFGRPLQASAPRVAAPPPVPSFGNPLLPSKPPPPADAARKPKKKKRKHNQLGLTPKTEEHESSEEEDDVDEEARLAAEGVTGAASASAPLQFTYRGRTSTLQSPEDIKAWIEERKKRFPTQARVEEKKKAMEEAKKAREEALRQKKLQRQEQKPPQKDSKNQKGREQQSQKDGQKDSNDPVDIAAKAKLKADKLRRKLMREEKRVAKAEADAERARMKVEELQKSSTSTSTHHAQPVAHRETAPDSLIKPAEPTTLPAGGPAVEELVPANDANAQVAGVQVDAGASVSSLDDSDSSDWTSSSGSESSSEDSDDSDDDAAPEEATTKREGPERVPPPAREPKKKVCRHFARNGRCLHGNRCKFSHEMPERGAKTKAAEQKGRKGLLQALLDRQKTEDDRKVMEAIVWLGENGMLDTPKEPEDSNGATSLAEEAKAAPGNEERQEGEEVAVMSASTTPNTAPGQGADAAAAPTTA
ncbi:hypothetical protein BO86DRAFT_372845 [Aspergillus japonicus CBS 114.51]|uniref:C3H1-type domain-containing protein n=1 Tax=Aspergillus japonicus CBS 114.51 TaxID=1448312 RepID=A0A8T8WKR7_ASPJA|nr:hypothetical protein BO86DRAFT_372845 [Aspergillus japonicus CBS 114.51]RAH76435.1 hypothetical protein BO86DRAFT_372845 [Aspergillus japonicus CBS 114.51]